MATAVKVLTAASLLTSPNFDRFNRFPLSATATDRSGSRHVLSQGIRGSVRAPRLTPQKPHDGVERV
ncbi:hypothetical protein QR680_002908 [Steinernema hermaphroditum]|uniref:Uncharacterized protein n=1 Tax=Steinernema hermaphroditum TaxID=289476 RepID=A0AA39LJA5_9BILA|nr:hypothetical protein QR680_002908 [Steinernema hermaphroditum]